MSGSVNATDNVAVGYQALSQIGGNANTAIGAYAGSAISTGAKNSILGGYTGNQGGLDIRTLSNYIVLSDGDGNPRLWIDNTGAMSVPGGGSISGSLTITGGTVTASNPVLQATQTWNNAGVTFTGWRLNVTDTASNAASLLMDLQVGGVSRFAVEKGLSTTRFTVAPYSADANFGIGLFAGTKQGGVVLTRNGFIGYRSTSINQVFEVDGSSGVFIASAYALAWSSTGGTENSKDLFILRDAANTLAQRNATNAQTFRIYNTFTDASNYERGAISWVGNTLYLSTERAGTGQARDIWVTSGRNLFLGAASGNELRFYLGASAIWKFNSGGHFIADVDNTYDIGASGANRPRTVFAATSVLAPYVRTATAYTVATLPAAATAGAGARAYVTDANAATFASVVAGGGANTVPVMSNGTDWIIG